MARTLNCGDTSSPRRFRPIFQTLVRVALSGGFPVVSEKSKATTVLPGKVEKVINPHPNSGEPEKAQIAVEGADHLYREIRVPNRLVDDNGRNVKLKEGAEVDVKIEADQAVTNKITGAEGGDNRANRNHPA